MQICAFYFSHSFQSHRLVCTLRRICKCKCDVCSFVLAVGTFCLAGELKVKVQPMQNSVCTQCRHRDGVLFMRELIMQYITIGEINRNLLLI